MRHTFSENEIVCTLSAPAARSKSRILARLVKILTVFGADGPLPFK